LSHRKVLLLFIEFAIEHITLEGITAPLRTVGAPL